MSSDSPSQRPSRYRRWLIVAGVSAAALFFFLSAEQRRQVRSALKLTAAKFIDFVWPSLTNDYQPKVFRAGAAHRLVLLVIALKVGSLVALLILYPSSGRSGGDIKQDIYRLINSYRQEQQVAPLLSDPYLDQVAWNKAQDMLKRNYFSHVTPDGRKPWQWLDSQNYDFSFMGENLAKDFLTAPAVLRAFQKSPSHDRNLLQAEFEDVGVAVVSGQLQGRKTNVMVIMFGATGDHLGSRSSAKRLGSKAVASAPATTSVASLKPNDSTELTLNIVPTPSTVLGQAVKKTSGQIEEAWPSDAFVPTADTPVKILLWERIFLTVLLAILVLLFAINLLVKIRIQRVSVIANGLVLVAVLALALTMNIYQAQAVTEIVTVLGLSLP